MQPAAPGSSPPVVLGEYALVHAALRHRDLTVEHPFRPTRQIFGPTAIDTDGARHRELRACVAWFSARQVAAWQDRAITPVVSELASALPPGEPADFVSFAWQLPARVILRVLGCPDQDAGWVWQRLGPVIRHIACPGSPVAAAESGAELRRYLQDVLAAGPPDDTVLGSLAGRFSRDTVVRAGLLLLAAGTATTAAAAANLLACLLRHPGTWADLREGTLLPSEVVREALRVLPPLLRTVRFVTADVVLGGTLVPRGSVVELDIAAANTDPAVFDRPQAFDPRRPGHPIMSFGTGPHACAGALLALRELESLLAELTRRFSSASAVAGATVTMTGDLFCQPERLDVVFREGAAGRQDASLLT